MLLTRAWSTESPILRLLHRVTPLGASHYHRLLSYRAYRTPPLRVPVFCRRCTTMVIYRVSMTIPKCCSCSLPGRDTCIPSITTSSRRMTSQDYVFDVPPQ